MVDRAMLAGYRAAAKLGYKHNAPRALHQAGVALCNMANGMGAQSGHVGMDSVVDPDHSATLQAIASWILENCSDEDIAAHIDALTSVAADEPADFPGKPNTGGTMSSVAGANRHINGSKGAQDMAFDLRYPGASRVRVDSTGVGGHSGRPSPTRGPSMNAAAEEEFAAKYPGADRIRVL